TKWDRKQYYYPDLPKGYQISQYDLPMSDHGYLEITSDKGQFEPKRVRITRAHLEEDAGKSIHDEGAGTAVAGKADSEIDLNRTGTPLLEIVSEPDMRSSAEAKTFLQELKLLLTYLGVSDCNMQEGSLRVDANVNLHVDTPTGKVGKPAGQIATPIVEIKNMNSFRAVERALDYEAERQYRVWQETGQKLGEAPKQTRGWDDAAGVTRGQRSKEESSDYRYFPDPDLVPVITTPEQVEKVRASLGELPAQLRTRLTTDFGLSPYDARVLVNQGRELFDYYLKVAELSGDAKTACNWVTQDVLRSLKELELPIQQFELRVSSSDLAKLINEVEAGGLLINQAHDIYAKMSREVFVSAENKASISDTTELLGIEKVDESELMALCQELLDKNPKIVADLRRGKHQAIGALIGQAKQRNPNVDPGRVREICLKLIQQ
ncbi:MAG: Asp-tRNA(Asn)/Glu-tRNA(Gln) amidotransferase subunit GatB, partial [Planctomycetes bacterium]|nr:Asp-tRNA(Asn)/Glu-tRNA(Gln) amidotransferase subunit GatB [Planctomycetota bacterium]